MWKIVILLISLVIAPTFADMNFPKMQPIYFLDNNKMIISNINDDINKHTYSILNIKNGELINLSNFLPREYKLECITDNNEILFKKDKLHSVTLNPENLETDYTRAGSRLCISNFLEKKTYESYQFQELPDGPWKSLWADKFDPTGLRYFSCGKSCYLLEDFYKGKNKEYAHIHGQAYRRWVTGLYIKKTESTKWEHIIKEDIEILKISLDECQIAWQKAESTTMHIKNMCH